MAEQPDTISVLLVDRDLGSRRRLSRALRAWPGITIGAEAGDPAETLHVLATPGVRPHVALLDAELEDGSAYALLEHIRQYHPDIVVIMRSTVEDESSILRCLMAGALGYLHKYASTATVIEAIQAAHDGGSPLSPGAARKLVQVLTQRDPTNRRDLVGQRGMASTGGRRGGMAGHGVPLPEDRRSAIPLTSEESNLLRLIARGFSNREIAILQKVPVNMIDLQVKAIYRKLAVQSRRGAVSAARDQGLRLERADDPTSDGAPAPVTDEAPTPDQHEAPTFDPDEALASDRHEAPTDDAAAAAAPDLNQTKGIS